MASPVRKKTKKARATAKETQSTAEEAARPTHAYRETAESIIVAVILAFLFRTFVAEAFIIPTGSMAPTLQGKHVDVACDGCGFRYRCGASTAEPTRIGCPNCGLVKEPELEKFSNEAPFSGDRILVSKFAYDLKRPQRWDVIVFKFPGNAKQNYIKRLVGLPNELVKVWRGNAYTSPLLFNADASLKNQMLEDVIPEELRATFSKHDMPLTPNATIAKSDEIVPFDVKGAHGSEAWTRLITDGNARYILTMHSGELHVYKDAFEILRKPPAKLLAMLQCLHDTSYVNDKLHQAGWPLRWCLEKGWTTDDLGATYDIGGAEDLTWLSYRHINPTPNQWAEINAGKSINSSVLERPGELITDTYAYNYNNTGEHGSHWVSDLALEARVQWADGDGAVWLDLVRGGRHYRCRFDMTTGDAQLEIDGGQHGFGPDGKSMAPKASTSMRGMGRYRLRMANVDDQIHVWVNNNLLEFDAPTTYGPPANDAPFWSPADPGDTQPASIGCEKGSMSVTEVRLLRDIYYIAVDAPRSQHQIDDDFGGEVPSFNDERTEFWSTPSLWMQMRSAFSRRHNVTYSLGEGEYFPMGDNSPFSDDARRWSHPPHRLYRQRLGGIVPHYVSEELMIGKALLIYWPHAWRPFLPNFKRMGLIR